MHKLTTRRLARCMRTPRMQWMLVRCTGLGLVTAGLVACSDNSTGPTATPPFLMMRLNQHAVTLALTPGADTAQLAVTVRMSTGAVFSPTNAVVYTVNDSSLTVSPTGLITAKYVAAQPVAVTAHLTVGNVTLTEVALVKVTDTPLASPLATLSIQPQAGDSAKWGARFGNVPPVVARKTLAVTATDEAGATIPAPFVRFTSSDPTVATIDPLTGVLLGLRPGSVTFYAETDLYGVTRRDSLPYVIGYPVFATVTVLARTPVASLTPELYFQPSVVTVGVGAAVTWQNTNADSIDVVFDDTTNVLATCRFPGTRFCNSFPATGLGNIPLWTRDPNGSNSSERQGFRSRLFPVAGMYPYHSTRYPTSTGVIIVKPDP